MFSTTDTIVAIATPPGRGGLGVVRLSGADAFTIAATLVGRDTPFPPRVATFAHLARHGPASVGDEVVVTVFPAPRSYTGDDVAEISAHGSPVVMAAILEAATAAGARLAAPGEFTLRGFLNGKRDLVQSEAVADLIDATTPLQARAAFDQLQGTLTSAITAIDSPLFDLVARLEASLDFPDEGYHFVAEDELAATLEETLSRMDRLLEGAARGRLVREGATVAIVGAPNVGKSSLFNALLDANRAIVAATAGTTRDVVTERVEVGGLLISLADTAGLRESEDEAEQEGVRRSHGSLQVADLALVVLDGSRALSADDERALGAAARGRRLVVINKIDLPDVLGPADLEGAAVRVSVATGEGIGALAGRIAAALGSGPEMREAPAITNLRHVRLLEEARVAIARAAAAARAGGTPEEFVLADLQEALEHLQAVTGRRTTDDLLHHIFARFCIGK